MFALSVKDVKTILQMEDTSNDGYIQIMLPIILSLVEEYCNDTTLVAKNDDGSFIKTNEAYQINQAGLVIAICKIIEFYTNQAGVSQNMVGRVSYMFSTDLPQSILTVLNSYRKVKFV